MCVFVCRRHSSETYDTSTENDNHVVKHKNKKQRLDPPCVIIKPEEGSDVQNESCMFAKWDSDSNVERERDEEHDEQLGFTVHQRVSDSDVENDDHSDRVITRQDGDSDAGNEGYVIVKRDPDSDVEIGDEFSEDQPDHVIIKPERDSDVESDDDEINESHSRRAVIKPEGDSDVENEEVELNDSYQVVKRNSDSDVEDEGDTEIQGENSSSEIKQEVQQDESNAPSDYNVERLHQFNNLFFLRTPKQLTESGKSFICK